MDVRCERCRTEYELDDARVTEAGVAVKCSNCGHQFRVKKKALVVTVPLKPGEHDPDAAPLTPSSPPPSTPASGSTPATSAAAPAVAEKEKGKEWKVRQVNGNVFSFKELTTLQAWIVERKVGRDDEISLTGESWKRLGNIPELASFFQVVEEAQKAAQLAALQSSGLLSFPPQPPGGAAPTGGPVTGTASAAPPAAPADPTPPPAPAAPEAGRPPRRDEPGSTGSKKSSGPGRWIALALLLVAGGGYGLYAFYWVPRQHARQEAAEAEQRRRQELAAIRAKAQEDARKAAEEKARAEEEARAAALADAGIAATAPDAGTAVAALPPDAGTAVAAEPADAGPGQDAESAEGEAPAPAQAKTPRREAHTFDWYMRQGDRLREREKAEASLDAYARATELEPDRAEPIAGRGLALLDMGSKLQAEAAFGQALKLNPRYGVAIMGLAETYRAEGKTSEAIKYYEKYLDLLPNGPEATAARAAIKRLQE